MNLPSRFRFCSKALIMEILFKLKKQNNNSGRSYILIKFKRNKINAEILPLNTCQNTTHTRLRWWGRLSSWCHFERSKLTNKWIRITEACDMQSSFCCYRFILRTHFMKEKRARGEKQHLTGVACTMCHWTSFAER